MQTNNSRLFAGLKNYARQIGKQPADAERAFEFTIRVAKHAGAGTQGRKVMYQIGKAVLQSGTVHILAPVCPDYHHENGKYTFRGLGNKMPLLGKMHLAFLEKVRLLEPSIEVYVLIADLEANDPVLCSAVNLSKERFKECLLGSLEAVREAVQSYGWTAEFMSSFIPDLEDRERLAFERIRSDPSFSARIISDTMQRDEMYQRINRRLTTDEKRARTVRTAAQYAALGAYAAEHGFLVLNHTTVNLSWFRDAGAGLLHNPITVY